ncbi:MAG: hypothetical protein AAF389_01110 [Gemmatimonadota bacterium]
MIGLRALGRTAAALLVCGPVAVSGQDAPNDVVSTAYVTDTIAGYGAVGGVAVDALGFVYVADFQNAVWRYGADGSLVKFADGLYGASGNAIGPRGYLYQSSFNGNYLSRISRTGEVETWVDEGLNGPVGIAAAPDGSLFVVNCSGNTVSRISPEREVSEFATHELMACPNGITFDDQENLYVVSFNTTQILKITSDGTASVFADVPGAGGNGHITFARGAFYVTKLRGNQIYRVQRDGTVTTLAGTGVAGSDDGPALSATFTRPNGIGASPSGNELWINDHRSGQGLGIGVSVVALRQIRLASIADAMAEVPAGGDPDQLRRAYDAYHAMRAGENSSTGAITLAYAWLSGGRVGDAQQLFSLNAERYPTDPNSVFQLGEFYRYTGRPQQAAEQYRAVLELDPSHNNAASRLAEVSGG